MQSIPDGLLVTLPGPASVTVNGWELFAGPAISPAWAPEDVQAGEIGPVHALALNGGRERADGTGAYAADPALAAAAAFRDALADAVADRGIEVAPDVVSGRATEQAPVLAAVESATVAAQANYLLLHSDNKVAEVMARKLALASQNGRAHV